MDDLMICRRIAEIECVEVEVKLSINNKQWLNVNNHLEINSHSKVFVGCRAYNPLTDDALCLKLIDKHNVSINVHFQYPDTKQAYVRYIKDFKVHTTSAFSINDLGINRAICLAIIESHKEDNNG